MDALIDQPEGPASSGPHSSPAPLDLDHCMPPEALLAMPTQSLRRFEASKRCKPAAPHLWRTPWLSRLFVFGGGLALTVYCASEMYGVINIGAITTLKWALLVLFICNFSWIAIAFTSGVLGFFWLLLHGRARPVQPGALKHRTAVVMPIYNEAPSRVFSAMQAIHEDVAATGLGAHFDWFFLSDTTNPDVWIAEERAFIAMRARLGPQARIFYRRRPKNTAARPAISPISSSAGAALTSIWWFWTPTA